MNSLLLLLALSVSTAKPADVAYLALEKEAAVIAEPLRGVDQRRSVGVRDASAAPPSASGRLSPVIYGRARTTEGIDRLAWRHRSSATQYALGSSVA